MTDTESTIGGLWARDLAGEPGGPLIVGFHGRSSWPERLEAYRPKIAGARHVIPRGIFTSGEGFAWYLGRPAPEDELAASIEALQPFFAALWSQGHSPDRTLIWGYSQGAMVALQLSVTLPQAPAGVVAIGPRLHRSAALFLPRAKGQRFLLLQGESDEIIVPAAGLEAQAQLEGAGAACTWILYPGGHEITPRVTEELQAFAARVLARPPPN